jgi:hypothetical protein
MEGLVLPGIPSGFLLIVALSMIVFVSACDKNQAENSIQNEVQNQLHGDGKVVRQTVELSEIGYIGNGEDHFLEGMISDFEVDEDDRVYIVSSSMDKTGISVFSHQGTFLQKIGRKGRGPGDFQGITDIVIRDDLLHVFDFNLKRISVFELDTYSLQRIIILEEMPSDEVLLDFSMLHVTGDGSYVMGLMEPANLNRDGERIMYIRMRDPSGKIMPGNLTHIRLPEQYSSDDRPGPGYVLPFTTPFSRKSLIDFDNRDQIYTSWSENVAISVMNPDGQLIRDIRHNYERPDLDVDDLDLSKPRLDVLEKYDLPEKWPAVYELIVSDDEIWVGVFTGKYGEFKWLVFDEAGDP